MDVERVKELCNLLQELDTKKRTSDSSIDRRKSLLLKELIKECEA